MGPKSQDVVSKYVKRVRIVNMSFFPLSLSFVSLLVGKEKGADLTFCPWYYKLMVDPLSFLKSRKTLFFK